MRSEDLTLFRSIADGIDALLYNQLQHPDEDFIESIEKADYFADKSITYDFEDMEDKLGVSLRYYQRMALYFTQCYLEQHYLIGNNDNNKLTYWMATGSGKTIIMQANIIDYFEHVRANNPEEIEVIITSPLKELIGQLRVEMRDFFQRPFFNDFNWSLKIETTQGLVESYKKRSHDIVGDKHFRLLLVDEAHIGLGGTDKGAFTTVRNELTKNIHQSFMFEYSATFYDVSDSHKDEYAERIIYEYDYGKFYNDQYGKDFKFGIVHKDDIAEDENKDIQRNLDENLKVFGDKLAAFEQYNQAYPSKPFLDRPLLVMAGNTVSASAEKKADNEENSDIAKIIGYFAELPKISLEASLFHVQSGALHMLRSAEDGEVLLSYGENIEPFGLITVGDVSKFLANRNIQSLIESGQVILKTQKFTPEQHHFRNIDRDTSPINILIGSRKFSAGWNSFRVSQICLINFGTGKGSTIVQMFGRGVRLKGLNGDGKRQEIHYVREGDGEKVEFENWGKRCDLREDGYNQLKHLETLFVYSLRSTYLSKFIEEDTDIYKPSITISKDVTIEQDGISLPIFRIQKQAVKKDEEIVCTIELGKQKERAVLYIDYAAGNTHMELPLSLNLGVQNQELVSYQDIEWLEAFIDKSFVERYIEQKLVRSNISIKGLSLAFVLSSLKERYIKLYYDADLVSPLQFQKVLIKVVDQFVSKVKNKVNHTKQNNAYNFNQPVQNDDCISQYDLRFILAKGRDAQKVRTALDKDKNYKVFFDIVRHLYQPLAADPHGDIKQQTFDAMKSVGFNGVTQNTDSLFSAYENYFDGVESIKVSPDKLNPYEVKFVVDMQAYIQDNHLQATILRNKSGGDIGLLGDEGVFYPDFIVWYQDKDGQDHIIFCDPKGISRSETKWKVCEAPYAIKDIEAQWSDSAIQLHSFVISNTPLKDVKWHPIVSLHSYEHCDVLYNLVFFEDESYIKRIFSGLTTDMRWHSAFQKCIQDMDEQTIDEWSDDEKRSQHIILIEKILESEELEREQAVLLYFKVWGASDKIKEKLKKDTADDVKEQVVIELLGEVVSEVILDTIPYVRTLRKIYDIIT